MRKINAEFWGLPPGSNLPMNKDDVYKLIVKCIKEGRLKPGEKLPPYRNIAEDSKLSKTAAELVYVRLLNNGWTKTIPGSGTFVSNSFPNYELLYPNIGNVKSLPIMLNPSFLAISQKEHYFQDYARIGFDTPCSEYINNLLNQIRSKKYVGIHNGFNQMSRLMLTQGTAYKAAIFEYMSSKRNFMINTDGLEVIVGRNESLQQVFDILLNTNDVVVNTSPKDQQLCNILSSYEGLEIYNINSDEYFLPNLKRLLANTKIKALHIRPQCSHLENYTLNTEVCTELLDLAKQHGFYIVEEDDYHESWISTSSYTPLIQQNHEGHVIYCGAFSLISTYLEQTRTIVAAEEFINLIKRHPVTISPFKDYLTEMALADLLNNGKLGEIIKKMKLDMKANKFQAEMQIDNAIGRFVKFEKTTCGLSFWLICPSDEWLKKSFLYLETLGFKIPYFPDSQTPGAGVQKVSLGFGTWNIDEAEGLLKALHSKCSI